MPLHYMRILSFGIGYPIEHAARRRPDTLKAFFLAGSCGATCWRAGRGCAQRRQGAAADASRGPKYPCQSCSALPARGSLRDVALARLAAGSNTSASWRGAGRAASFARRRSCWRRGPSKRARPTKLVEGAWLAAARGTLPTPVGLWPSLLARVAQTLLRAAELGKACIVGGILRPRRSGLCFRHAGHVGRRLSKGEPNRESIYSPRL